MEIKASATNVRIAPRKLRMIADLIKKMKPQEAVIKLGFLPKSGAIPMQKVLKSAIANAQANFKKDVSNLSIKGVLVDEGLKMRRRDKGHSARANSGLKIKRASHITLVLEG
jgi:large subunit ribosomal protein L22